MRQPRVLGVLAAAAAVALLAVASPATAATAATDTTTTLTSSANPSAAGQPITLTATVTGDAPTGQVVFGEPGITLGVADLSSGVATLVVSSLSVGSHVLSATYTGDAGNNYSYVELNQTVAAPPVAPVAPVAPVVPVVPVKPPEVKLVASTTKASVGDMIVLRWHSKNADSLRASGDWSGTQKPKGSKTVRINERGTHTFKLTVQNASGHKTATVKVVATRKAKELELLVSDEPVLIGDDVELTADGLAPAEPFTLRLDSKVIMTGTADKKGDVVRTIEVPKGTPEGPVPLTITGSNPGRIGTAVLNVIGPTKLEVSVGAPEVYKRDSQTISVSGLLPGEAVTVTLGGKKLTSGTADATGQFTYTYKVTKPLGKQTVTVTGVIPSRVGKASYTVLDPGRGPNNGG